MTIFERIQLLARNKGKSVKEVARDLGFGESTIYKWKVQSPKGVDLEKVAKYFDVNVDYLLGRTINPNPLETEDENIPPEYFAIQRKSKKLNQKDQQRLLKIMEATFDDLDNGNFEEDDDDDL
ncbi:XRE family transcriptional regulator [Enterococcus faecium]|nr:XRE family transcriptional regulator [Enterococcus faecium]